MLASRHALRREIHVSGATYVCWSCRLQSQSRPRPRLGGQASDRERVSRREGGKGIEGHVGRRAVHGGRRRDGERAGNLETSRTRAAIPQSPYHTSHRAAASVAATAQHRPAGPAPPPPPSKSPDDDNILTTGGIRDQLRQWQELHGKGLDAQYKMLEQPTDPDEGDSPNNLTRLPDPGVALREQAEREEEEQRSIAYFSRTPELDDGSTPDNSRFLAAGDLIELEFPKSERESIIAVFVRRCFAGSQVFTMHGRGMFIPERSVQYSVPGWVSPELIQPLLEYLPDPQNAEELEEMQERAYLEDLSVPRAVAGPLVRRMVLFHTESQDIYRRHATALDDAHGILAHDTDLRYGSLVSAAATLLKTPAAKLPVTALFTVRKALSAAGFAFNIDRRSHRLTGYLQIRSREQCRMVETVRDRLREWQDDMAVRASLQGDERALRRHKTNRGAELVYSFLEKARLIVLQSRQHRDVTTCGNVGPSKKRFPITPTSEAVRSSVGEEFTAEDTELVRFLEAWSCSNMYLGLPRIESLPPLLLHATGLYEELDLNQQTGFVFLQELGTITPYENRVRFDQHLLLPSSEHSKPLQHLMTSLMDMADKHDFQDSMADLRHDWGDMPVFCIDDASAQEIDDGVSVQSAGEGQWWVHIHIANPTAFFSRDHPLAKMARHMGETIYMPERAYMMLPRWATKKHFSLAKDRPALTFSIKLDSVGRTLEHKIQPSFIRNVLRLTHTDIATILGEEQRHDEPFYKIITVGGDPPPPRAPNNMLRNVTLEMVEQLKSLQYLAQQRNNRRKAAGGVFFDLHNANMEVFQSARGPGLGWDHPYRKGSRIVEGDPVIRLSTKGFTNFFTPTEGAGEVLVREMMLLACETAAKWCAERKVPAIFRGTVKKPDQPDSEAFLRDVLQPAAAKHPEGEYPMHLGMRYLNMLGTTVLSTKPIPHKTLGMAHYGKVTSPLRRYGDMILHWQIEAAIREEARTGKSLVTDKDDVDRTFLPFSAPVLDTIKLGLQPREQIIQRAKAYASHFWSAQLLFRAYHYGEAPLPFTPTSSPPGGPSILPPGQVSLSARPPTPPQEYICRVFVQSANNTNPLAFGVQSFELNIPMSMERPERFGLGEARQGDVWECVVLHVNVYRRTTFVRPLRLVERSDQD